MKILIVDDEVIIRQWFAMMIKGFNNPNLIVAGAAKNGAEALEFCRNHRIDLVVTDIKMPVMDGLEFIKCLKDELPQIKTIILTAYDEFEYALKAIKYGALDYMLKSETEAGCLEKLLVQVYKELQEEDNPHLYKDDLLKIFNKQYYVLRNLCLSDIIKNGAAADVFARKKEMFNINIEDSNIIFGIVKVRPKRDMIEEEYKGDQDLFRFAVINIMEEILTERFANNCGFYYDDNHFVYLFNTNRKSEKELRENMIFVVNKLYYAIETYLKSKIYVCGTISKDNIGTLHRRMDGLFKAVSYQSFYDLDHLCIFEDMQLAYESDHFKSYSQKLAENLEANNVEEIRKNIEAFFEEIKSDKKVKPEEVQKISMAFLSMLFAKITTYMKGEHAIDAKSSIVPYEKMLTLEECEKHVNAMLEKLMVTLNHSCRCLSQQIVLALAYIHKNYSQDIALNEVAHFVNMNRSYLSELFKKEIGDNFINYLTAYRMNKSKKLLRETNLSINEIAERVGYHNISYFTKIFKKYVDMTPRDYRKQ